MLLNDPAELSFTQIADAYVELRKEGKSISVQEFADAVPAYRDEIISRLPAMVLLEDMFGANPEREFQIGADTEISGCLIEKEIGRGTSAVVFKAHQKDFDRKVAMKVIKRSHDIARLDVECRAMARLDHSNIIQPYSFARHDDCDCLIMRYVDGYSLHQLIDRDCDYHGTKIASQLTVDWDQFAVLASDAADALAHAHSHGIVHRDVKPSNLMVDRNGKVWVMDFGLTKMLNEPLALSTTGQAIGTPRFMAPEQLQGVCDERSDIYSLGLTLYALATGSTKHVNTALSDANDSDYVITNLSEVNPDMPHELARVVMKACQLDPGDRYQTAREMRLVLDRFLAGRVPDRRRRNRKKDRFYIRNVVRKAAIATAILVAVSVGWASSLPVNEVAPAASADLQVNPRISEHPTLLDNLVDQESDDLDSLVAGLVKRHIDDAMDSIHLPVSVSNRLRSRIADLIDNNGIHDETVRELISTYRQSTLADGTRVLRLSRIIDRSSLSLVEKRNGIESIWKLAHFVVKQRIQKQEAEQIEWLLTFNRAMSASELNATPFSDNRIRSWLQHVNSRLNQERPFQEIDSVDDEIEALFDSLQSGVSRGST